MFFIIIRCNSSLGRLFSSCGFGLRVWYWLRNLTSHISPQFMTLEKDSHILRSCMITSRTIQHNGDRTYDISFILLIHNEENDQKVGFGDLKCRNGAQNQNLHEKLSKTSSVDNFLLGQSQQSTVWSKPTAWSAARDTDMAVWRHPRADVAIR